MECALQVGRIMERNASGYYWLRARSIEGIGRAAEPEVLRELGAGRSRIADVLRSYEIEGTRVWGVFDAAVLVGTIGASRIFEPRRLDTVRLWGVFVVPRYRGTAVSRLLMEAVAAWCEHEPSIAWMVACIPAGNLPARQYFARFGFEPAGLPGGPEETCDRDVLRMRRRV